MIEQNYKFQKLFKKCFILSNLILFLVSFFIIIPLGQVFKNLQYKCPLYASLKLIETTSSKLSISETNESSSAYFIIDENKSKWSLENNCEFGLASGILCVFYSVILLFFSMFSIKNRMDKQILPVWAIYNVFQFLSVFTSAIRITNGFTLFCSQLTKQSIPQLLSCRQCQFIKWKIFQNKHLFDYLAVCTVSIWFCLLLIVFNQFIVIIRIRMIYFSNNNAKQQEELLILKYSKLSKKNRFINRQISSDYTLNLNNESKF